MTAGRALAARRAARPALGALGLAVLGLAVLGLAVLALALPALALALAAPPHSAHVADAQHAPDAPARGDAVTVRAALRDLNESDLRRVALTYCRVENYACAQPIAMDRVAPLTYQAAIPWREDFFHGVHTVGYEVSLRFTNGTAESSPTANWPSTPAALPAGTEARYYFYDLPEEPKTLPGPAPASLALATALAALALRRWSA